MEPGRNRHKFLIQIRSSTLIQYLVCVTIIGSTALICAPLANTQNYHVVSFILLFAVSILSTFMAIGPVLLASTLSALAWNFYFIPPHHTFHIEKTEDILIFALFFIIALINGVLTTRVRRQEKLTREREKKSNALFQLTKELSKAGGIDEVLKVASEELDKNFHLKSLFYLQDGNNNLVLSDRLDSQGKLTEKVKRTAIWVFQHAKKAGAHTDNFGELEYTLFPMAGTRLKPGVLITRFEKILPDDQESYWDTFLTQISNALEREFLGELAQKVRFLDESDRLYKTLFNSISHEFRIPVATIMGASDSILNSSISEEVRVALCSEIFTASLRLNRLIENLLNISRLESGHISVRLDWYDINDLVNNVADDLKDELQLFNLQVSIPEEMSLVKIDFGLMEHVLYNLLFNSTQYAPANSTIYIDTFFEKENLVITIIDEGPGFPEALLNNVFNKFFKVDGRKTGGLGLGLSIVKGFIEAHNGSVIVYNTNKGGAAFKLTIPSEKAFINDI